MGLIIKSSQNRAKPCRKYNQRAINSNLLSLFEKFVTIRLSVALKVEQIANTLSNWDWWSKSLKIEWNFVEITSTGPWIRIRYHCLEILWRCIVIWLWKWNKDHTHWLNRTNNKNTWNCTTNYRKYNSWALNLNPLSLFETFVTLCLFGVIPNSFIRWMWIHVGELFPNDSHSKTIKSSPYIFSFSSISRFVDE